MPEKGDTAERELLKTIEGDKELSEKFKTKKSSNFVLSLKSWFSFSFDKIRENISSGTIQLGPGLINKALLVVIGIIFVFQLLAVIKGMKRLRHIPHFEVSGQSAVQEAADKVMFPNLKNKAYYARVLLDRNIFDIIQKEKTKDKKPKKVIPKINQMVENLRLRGISWSESKDERWVMVEDEQSKVTYFLQEGDKVLNLDVKEILPDKVKLSLGQEVIDLR